MHTARNAPTCRCLQKSTMACFPGEAVNIGFITAIHHFPLFPLHYFYFAAETLFLPFSCPKGPAEKPEGAANQSTGWPQLPPLICHWIYVLPQSPPLLSSLYPQFFGHRYSPSMPPPPHSPSEFSCPLRLRRPGSSPPFLAAVPIDLGAQAAEEADAYTPLMLPTPLPMATTSLWLNRHHRAPLGSVDNHPTKRGCAPFDSKSNITPLQFRPRSCILWQFAAQHFVLILFSFPDPNFLGSFFLSPMNVYFCCQ